MRLGLNAVRALSNGIENIENTNKENRKTENYITPLYSNLHDLNLADNAISDYCMHAIKSIMVDTKLKSLNLASNMISGEGLELLLDDFV